MLLALTWRYSYRQCWIKFKLKILKITINEVIAIGGVATKSPFVMQILSDILDMPIKVAKSSQAVALGAAMFSSVVAGIYPNVEKAQENMLSGFSTTYYPDSKNVKVYKELYERYKELGNILEDYLRNIDLFL
ncbi:MAG: hypothetical protein H5T85_02445 [Actinobacteria bacterium]|nr:hypothetical protein [Actinomycetota bacterium]